MSLSGFIDEFIMLGIIELLAVMSPGPDFVVTTQNSLRYGKRAGMMATLGVAVGCMVHVTYCIIGIDFIVDHAQTVFNWVKYIGASYMIYLGVKGLASKSIQPTLVTNQTVTPQPRSDFAAFRQGLGVNLLNPKASLFYISLFTLIIDPKTPNVVFVIYASEFFMINILWFGGLAWFFTNPKLRAKLIHSMPFIERLLGVILIIFGISIALMQP